MKDDSNFIARGRVLRVGGASTLLGDIVTMSYRHQTCGPKYQGSIQKPSDNSDYSDNSEDCDDSDKFEDFKDSGDSNDSDD